MAISDSAIFISASLTAAVRATLRLLHTARVVVDSRCSERLLVNAGTAQTQ